MAQIGTLAIILTGFFASPNFFFILELLSLFIVWFYLGQGVEDAAWMTSAVLCGYSLRPFDSLGHQ